jgi:hypothetical protein
LRPRRDPRARRALFHQRTGAISRTAAKDSFPPPARSVPFQN